MKLWYKGMKKFSRYETNDFKGMKLLSKGMKKDFKV